MRRLTLLVFALTSCQAARPCVEPQLDLWCYHSEAEQGPVSYQGEPPCDPPHLSADSSPCGAYEVVSEDWGHTGWTHYFKDGDHVATAHWTDTNTYCGGHQFWYGRRIECDRIIPK